ncbi:right-handed parallel beta-helix repeat-containing protein, partial [Subtercola sp. YIM 133946]|uniref:right-handed parallel beta-helix repeat-containing protein n=1 Tax=Subtercola sp. YIM 133946 TaxID=3118909 RepID=UPI002F926A6A
TSVQWVSRRTGASGISDVYIDNSKVATVDLYAASAQYQQVAFSTTSLSDSNHTITIRATGTQNAAANGSLIILDAFRIPKPTAPAALTSFSATDTATGVSLKWAASVDPDVISTQIYRAVGTSGTYALITTLPAGTTSYIHSNVSGPSTYKYYVKSVDYIGRTSSSSTSKSVTIPSETPYDYERAADCPTATATVSTVAAFKAALLAAAPGDVIRVLPGTYNAQFVISVKGTTAKPVWVCGSSGTIIKGFGDGGGNGFYINKSSNVVFAGFTLTKNLRGVMVENSTNITVSNNSILDAGQEGIHLRRNTTNSTAGGNTITNTGLKVPEYGEAVYIGSYNGDWCTYTSCDPDQSNGNIVVDNTMNNNTAEAVDAKEGTSGGFILGNTIDSTGSTATDRWIVIRGNGWFIADNHGSTTATATGSGNGILIAQPNIPGYGVDNIIVRNSAELHGTGYAVQVDKDDNIVGCNNTVSGTAKGTTNVTCQK